MNMKHTSPSRSSGSALVLVMVMCAISLIIMVGIMNRTSTVSKLNDRNNKYAIACAAAGAATEKVYARMAYDFQSYGLGQVTNNFLSGLYRTSIPTAAENSYWGNFVFSDPMGNTNQIYVHFLTNYAGPLPSQYTNLCTVPAPIYRIIANVWSASQPDIIGTAQEDVLLSLVPITTYAIFYNGPLEFTQCATMSVRGRTHANDIIAVGTSASLTFNGLVTSTKTISGPTRDGISPSPWNQNTTFNAGYTTNVPSVTISMSMTNSHSIIDIPPAGEVVSSLQGQVRLYNQAHVIILVTNLPAVGANYPIAQVMMTFHTSVNQQLPGMDTGTNIYSYVYTNVFYTNTTPPYKYTNWVFTNYTTLSTNQPSGLELFLSLTNRFTDKREYQTNMFVTQIDVGAYSNWLGSNTFIGNKFNSGVYPTILYVADQRYIGTNKLAVVRLVNGVRLPFNNDLGFSLATLNPLYVRGNYNTTADGTHYALTPDSTTNNQYCTVPAALLCDAITILSSTFTDSTSINTTGTASQSNVVNAAFITGNVPSTGQDAVTFSGGVHNLMRMQEDWSSSTLVLNTSIVVLYASQMATNQFRNPINWSGVINPYYSPPTRQWGFDPNFYNPAKQPPGIPQALVPIRFNWTVPTPGTTNQNMFTW
jgi:hypothetical protein